MVLKGIPRILSPELLYVLARMGHGDEIVFGDANFPTSSICNSGPIEVRADGHCIPDLLDAVLQLLPLKKEYEAAVMDLVPADKANGLETPVWDTYSDKLIKAGNAGELRKVEQSDFYERAKKAFAVVATGETALYGNIILKKDVIPSDGTPDEA
ncbi:fucose mutarotase-like isoform X2 [Branchiostoma floridae x Branchiostoma japonicum]